MAHQQQIQAFSDKIDKCEWDPWTMHNCFLSCPSILSSQFLGFSKLVILQSLYN